MRWFRLVGWIVCGEKEGVKGVREWERVEGLRVLGVCGFVALESISARIKQGIGEYVKLFTGYKTGKI